MTPERFFDLSREDVRGLFSGVSLVWEVLGRLPSLTAELLNGRRIIKGTVMSGATVEDGPVFIGEGARLEPGAYVKGPAFIGPGVTVRHGAYIREHCILMEGSVLGHASEAKMSLFLPGAKAPHFAYVGDSILGHRVNLGAGTKLSNVPITSNGAGPGRPNVVIRVNGVSVDTGLSKLGAVLGDDVQTGCNAVLNPGTLVGPRSLIYPNSNVPKGYHDPDIIIKLRQSLETSARHG